MLTLGLGSRLTISGSGARGPHGHGAVNDAGQELLSFLASHQATACNTWYEKRDIHLTTWQHPKSKSWSCIDYIVMRQKDRKLCVDVAVERGAECNTDHQFLCAEAQENLEVVNAAGEEGDQEV